MQVVREPSDLLKHTRVFDCTVQYHPGPNRPVYPFPLCNVICGPCTSAAQETVPFLCYRLAGYWTLKDLTLHAIRFTQSISFIFDQFDFIGISPIISPNQFCTLSYTSVGFTECVLYYYYFCQYGICVFCMVCAYYACWMLLHTVCENKFPLSRTITN